MNDNLWRELDPRPVDLLAAVFWLSVLAWTPIADHSAQIVARLALCALAGLPIGYGIGWLLHEADRLFDAYMDGLGVSALYWPAEVWR